MTIYRKVKVSERLPERSGNYFTKEKQASSVRWFDSKKNRFSGSATQPDGLRLYAMPNKTHKCLI